ncbi:MAG: hypothetical protein JWP79_1924 [Polaromonas sp.]|jgi:hypothetical protein|nr:hypothetical protein [Polaromonas sp.]
MSKTTWKPHPPHGELSSQDRDELPDSAFAFPKQRKEPLTDASHVRNALARFDQVQGVSDAERDAAFKNIQAAAGHFGVDVAETSWKELGKQPHSRKPPHA